MPKRSLEVVQVAVQAIEEVEVVDGQVDLKNQGFDGESKPTWDSFNQYTWDSVRKRVRDGNADCSADNGEMNEPSQPTGAWRPAVCTKIPENSPLSAHSCPISATTQPIELIFCRYFPCMFKILVNVLEWHFSIYFDLFPKTAHSARESRGRCLNIKPYIYIHVHETLIISLIYN